MAWVGIKAAIQAKRIRLLGNTGHWHWRGKCSIQTSAYYIQWINYSVLCVPADIPNADWRLNGESNNLVTKNDNDSRTWSKLF